MHLVNGALLADCAIAGGAAFEDLFLGEVDPRARADMRRAVIEIVSYSILAYCDRLAESAGNN